MNRSETDLDVQLPPGRALAARLRRQSQQGYCWRWALMGGARA
ncbi:MAG TPA: hypothetical protein VLM11_03050 [Streptosporangiaceae bacterium]|nr:hypothetical protein [Streptosporangiaceae bacterium]